MGDPLTLKAMAAVVGGIAFKNMGSNHVMPSIAAAVEGGVPLTGGDGNYLGVILRAIFLQTPTNLLVALGWEDAGNEQDLELSCLPC